MSSATNATDSKENKLRGDNSFNELLRYLQRNEFRIVMVEGPRGSGKTTFIDNVLKRTDFQFYKTWGRDQKNAKEDISDYGLALPQGTYFVLDLLAQIDISHPIIADRGNLSALAYQRAIYTSSVRKLYEYYVDLMVRSRALMLVINTPEETILQRRVARRDNDEQKLYRWDIDKARGFVRDDIRLYEDACCTMASAGLDYVFDIDIGPNRCLGLAPASLGLPYI